MTAITSKSSRRSNFWLERSAALWAFIFSAFHVVWAAGWYIGLEEEEARKAFQKTWTLVYDLVIAAICLVGGLIALSIIERWGRRLPGNLTRLLLWSGTGLLTLRAAAGVIHGVYLTVTKQFIVDRSLIWEVWFCLGAILFILTLFRFRHSERSMMSSLEID